MYLDVGYSWFMLCGTRANKHDVHVWQCACLR